MPLVTHAIPTQMVYDETLNRPQAYQGADVAARDAIASPAATSWFHYIGTTKVDYYDGTAWLPLVAGGGIPLLNHNPGQIYPLLSVVPYGAAYAVSITQTFETPGSSDQWAIVDANGNPLIPGRKIDMDALLGAPVITIVGDNPAVASSILDYTDQGATVTHSYYGAWLKTVTSAVVADVFTVTYSIDNGSNTYSATRTVDIVDNVAPTLTLLGDNPDETGLGVAYIDPGATANDPEDGDITANIVVTGTVDENTVGTYTLTYSITDSYGETVTDTRDVAVAACNGYVRATGTPYTSASDSAFNLYAARRGQDDKSYAFWWLTEEIRSYDHVTDTVAVVADLTGYSASCIVRPREASNDISLRKSTHPFVLETRNTSGVIQSTLTFPSGGVFDNVQNFDFDNNDDIYMFSYITNRFYRLDLGDLNTVLDDFPLPPQATAAGLDHFAFDSVTTSIWYTVGEYLVNIDANGTWIGEFSVGEASAAMSGGTTQADRELLNNISIHNGDVYLTMNQDYTTSGSNEMYRMIPGSVTCI